MPLELLREVSPGGGEAEQFLVALRSAADRLRYDPDALIVGFATDGFATKPLGALDVEYVPYLLRALARDRERPHDEMPVRAVTADVGPSIFWATVRLVDPDDSVLITFDDGTKLIAGSLPAETDLVVGWDTPGAPQEQIESVVSLLRLSEFLEALGPTDGYVAEKLARLLSEFAVTEAPPRGVVRETALWFARKLDKFVDGAMTAAGGLGVVGVAYLVEKHVQALRDQIDKLIALASEK